jgi:hypothetical protein
LTASRQSLRWLLAELLVVVLGILIAFYVDGARQAGEDRREEAAILAALTAELDENQALLETRLDRHTGRGLAAAQLLSVPSLNTPLSGDSLHILWERVLTPSTWNPNTGRSSAILSSGRLGLVRDADVRATVGNWHSELDSFLEVESGWRDFLRNEIEPWLDSSTLLSAAPLSTAGENSGVLGPPTPPAAHTAELTAHPVFRNYLTRFKVWSSWTVSNGRRLQAGMSGSLQLLEDASRAQ